MISWNTKVPVTFYLDNSFPKDKIHLIKEAMDTWNNIVGKQILVLQDEVLEGKDKKLKDGKNVISLVNSVGVNKLGVTYTWSRGDQIVEADILLIDKGTDIKTIIHELGHSLGLEHSEDENSIMFYAYGEDQEITKRDIKNIRCGY